MTLVVVSFTTVRPAARLQQCTSQERTRGRPRYTRRKRESVSEVSSKWPIEHRHAIVAYLSESVSVCDLKRRYQMSHVRLLMSQGRVCGCACVAVRLRVLVVVSQCGICLILVAPTAATENTLVLGIPPTIVCIFYAVEEFFTFTGLDVVVRVVADTMSNEQRATSS